MRGLKKKNPTQRYRKPIADTIELGGSGTWMADPVGSADSTAAALTGASGASGVARLSAAAAVTVTGETRDSAASELAIQGSRTGKPRIKTHAAELFLMRNSMGDSPLVYA
ncbi:MAG TPA: hypothetical protein VGE93_12310 [Bryobacteraceae bacterium]